MKLKESIICLNQQEEEIIIVIKEILHIRKILLIGKNRWINRKLNSLKLNKKIKSHYPKYQRNHSMAVENNVHR